MTNRSALFAAIILLCVPIGPFMLAFLFVWAVLRLSAGSSYHYRGHNFYRRKKIKWRQRIKR